MDPILNFPESDSWWAVFLPWFCAYSGSKATSPESQGKQGRQPLAAPFGTDNGSSWERETDRFGKDKVNGPN